MKQKTTQQKAGNAEELKSFVNQEWGDVYKTIPVDLNSAQMFIVLSQKKIRDTTQL